MAEATEPAAPDHLVVPLEVVPITVASWMQRHLQPQGIWHQWWGGGALKQFHPGCGNSTYHSGTPSKGASHIRDIDNTRSPVMLEAQTLMARTMTMPLEKAMKYKKKCSSSNIARSSSCKTNQKLVPESHLIEKHKRASVSNLSNC